MIISKKKYQEDIRKAVEEAGYTVRITSVVVDGKKVKGVQYW